MLSNSYLDLKGQDSSLFAQNSKVRKYFQKYVPGIDQHHFCQFKGYTPFSTRLFIIANINMIKYAREHDIKI